MAIHTNSKQGLPQPGIDAAREGRTVLGYVNAKTGLDTALVLTDATFLHNIDIGKPLVIAGFYSHISVDTDTMTVEWVTTADANGAGAVTVHTGQFRMATGTSTSQAPVVDFTFPVPLVLTRDDGKAFSARCLGNDAAAALYLQYFGWIEDV